METESAQHLPVDSKELSFNMKQKRWTLALELAPRRTRLDFSHGRIDKGGTLETQEGNPLNFTSSISHTAEQHPSMWISGIFFFLQILHNSFSTYNNRKLINMLVILVQE